MCREHLLNGEECACEWPVCVEMEGMVVMVAVALVLEVVQV